MPPLPLVRGLLALRPCPHALTTPSPRSCVRGNENVCDEGYTGLIVRGGRGGFADFVRVPADFAYRLPDALDSVHAAPLLCAGVTVYAPLARHMRAADRIAVVGVGGLGHLAVQFAAAMGGIVTAVDIDDSKADEARGFGAAAFLPLQRLMMSDASASAFDLILNTASVSLDTPALLRALANGGTLVQIGMPGGGAELKVPLLPLVGGACAGATCAAPSSPHADPHPRPEARGGQHRGQPCGDA